MNNFWTNGFSIEETKFSTLVLVLFVAFIYVIYADVANGYIYTDKIFDVIKWLIAGIAGINGLRVLGDLSDNTSHDEKEYDIRG